MALQADCISLCTIVPTTIVYNSVELYQCRLYISVELYQRRLYILNKRSLTSVSFHGGLLHCTISTMVSIIDISSETWAYNVGGRITTTRSCKFMERICSLSFWSPWPDHAWWWTPFRCVPFLTPCHAMLAAWARICIGIICIGNLFIPPTSSVPMMLLQFYRSRWSSIACMWKLP